MKREPQLPEFNKKKKTQIERDIAYCIDTLGLNNGQIGEMFRACEELGNISVQYFCEEFIFLAEMDELEREKQYIFNAFINKSCFFLCINFILR